MMQKAIYVVTGETVNVLREMKFENPEFGTAVLFQENSGSVGMSFKYLFLFEELPIEVEWKTENYVPDEDSAGKQEKINEATYALGAKYTVGKGKTVWTVDGHNGARVHVSREGKGINTRWVDPKQLKRIK